MIVSNIDVVLLKLENKMLLGALYVMRIVNWNYTSWKELNSEVQKATHQN